MKSLRAMAAVVVLGAAAPAREGATASGPCVLDVGIVDAAQSTAVGEAFRESFARRIAESLSAAADSNYNLRAECLQARDAARKLKAGEYAAVLVIGPDRPAALRNLDAVAFAGTLGWRRNCTTLYFIVATHDPRLRDLLAEGFRGAISEDTRSGNVAQAEP